MSIIFKSKPYLPKAKSQNQSNGIKILFASVFLLLSLNSQAEPREARYLFEFEGTNRVIYIDGKADSPDTASLTQDWGVYIGVPGNLRKMIVKNFTRGNFNGGSTFLLEGDFVIVENLNYATFISPPGTEDKLIAIDPTDENVSKKGINMVNPLKKEYRLTTIAPTSSSTTNASSARTRRDSDPLEVDLSRSTRSSEVSPNPSANASISPPVSTEEESEKPASIDGRQLTIDRAFRDDRGNLIIDFKTDFERYEVLGSNKTFWGPSQAGRLYQLQQKSSSQGAGELEITFLTPSQDNPEKTAILMATRNDGLTVTHDGDTIFFAELNDSEKETLQATIRSGFIGLESLPNVRDVRHIFQIKGTQQYIVVDSQKLNRNYDDLQVHMGQPGDMQPIEVIGLDKDGRSGPITIKLANGAALIVDSDGISTIADTTGERILERRTEPSVAFIREELGMDTSRFEMPILKTPVSHGQCFPLF